jgi:diacylglycerol O-acyltransferase
VIVTPVGVAVAGKVDGDEGTVEGQRHRVPRVRVLRAPVKKDDLGIGVAPPEGADPAPGLDLDGLTAHRWRTAPWQARLLGVLVKQRELVVVGRAHSRDSTRPTDENAPMERLTGLDAGFLYMETPTLHMHTLKIAVIDPSTVPDGYSFDGVKEELAKRLHLLPPFRRRLVDVPLRLHHPVWIEDPDFDLDYHVRRAVVASPGGDREFGELISDIASRQLDRRRPLWEIWVVEGLEGDNVGFVAKIHHAAADGVAAAAMLANVLDTEPQPHDPDPPADPWQPDPVPSSLHLLLQAIAALGRQLLALPALLRRTLSGLRAVSRRRREIDDAPPLPFRTPNTSFNGALTPHRWFAMASLSLDDVKAVKNAFGASVNDVILAVCAGALRHYLENRGELPDRPLVAGVPVSVPGDENRLTGNRVSNMFTSLRTDIADPVERLRAIHAVTKSAKELHNVLGAEMLQDWTEFTPPRPFAAWMRLYSRLRLAERHRPPINLVVSNVPGPTQPLYVAGARLRAIYSMGPVLEGIGLNITVWSYLDSMNFGLVGCRETMPDIWDLAGNLHEALEELKKAAIATA